MANPERGELLVSIGGTSYTLVLNTNALCALQGLFSRSDHVTTFEEVMDKVKQKSLVHIRGLFWAALRQHHPNISLEAAGGLLDGITAEELGLWLGLTMAMAQPRKEDIEALTDGKAPDAHPRKAQVSGRRGTSTSSIGTAAR